ncbi:hypothetical protein AYL99_03913 [Fonsecaea erecta]|uniref:SnoaL-like domain-containing protein n=1 Tax=Fonsecaea erecta TaxID=1367422 RepID=A0A178ZPH3_9EURO|nr:hypothetical protein AYL99_03913 [Fonsecaea erecta]OAP61710.1 hypothetical protein AYL99_03913 [Fonsecaea erecta]
MDAQAISDYLEITQRMMLWPEIVDTMSLDRLPELFLPDLVWDFGGGTVDHSLAAVRSRIEAHFEKPDSYCGATRHDLSNHIITLAGSERADSKVNVFAAHAGKGSYAGQVQLTWLTYEDKWRRVDGKWYIEHRTYRIQFTYGPDDIVYSTGRETWAEGDHRRQGDTH